MHFCYNYTLFWEPIVPKEVKENTENFNFVLNLLDDQKQRESDLYCSTKRRQITGYVLYCIYLFSLILSNVPIYLVYY